MASYTRILIDPTPAELESALSEAAKAANAGARARTVPAMTGARAFESPEGHCEDSGGGVAKSYGYRAGSSVTGYAWWTDPAGRLHVLVRGDRLPCSARHVSLPFWPTRAQIGGNVPYYAVVYRDLIGCKAVSAARAASKADRALVAELASRPMDADGLDALADLIDEDRARLIGGLHPAVLRQAAACLRKVLPAGAAVDSLSR